MMIKSCISNNVTDITTCAAAAWNDVTGPLQPLRLAGKNVSELTYFVKRKTLINRVNLGCCLGLGGPWW